MPKLGISVTLDTDNLLWLRTQAAANRRRSLSDTLDQIVTDARLAGRMAAGAVKSVVGTIDLAAADPDLDTADAYIGGLFGRSARRLAPPKPGGGEPAGRRRRPAKTGARAHGRSRRG